MSEPELMNKHDLVQEVYKLCNEISKLKQENARISSDLAIAEKFMEAKDRILDQIQKENERLRDALEIYATRTNWSYGESGDDYGDIVFKYNSNDGYYFAKKALEEIK